MFQNFNVKKKRGTRRERERNIKGERGRTKESDFEIFSNIQRHTLIMNVDRTVHGILTI